MSARERAADATVFVVDDDEAIRSSLGRLLEAVGLRVAAYADGSTFLHEYDGRAGCLLLDLRMPGLDGLELQRELTRRGHRIPVLIITGHGDVPQAASAFKAGALDFLRKPCDGRELLDRVRAALEQDAAARGTAELRNATAQRLAVLSPRERELLDLIAAGKTAKRIAHELSLSRKTVDIHRRHILLKLGLRSVVELVLMIRGGDAGDHSPTTA